MADVNIVKTKKAERRRRRVRAKVFGTPTRPRLSVARSLKQIYVQVIDDQSGSTIVGLGSTSKAMQPLVEKKDTKTAVARKVGLKIAELAKEKGIEAVVFDRNRFLYHGRVRAVAEGAREGGLKL
ncbi:MAG TPA: 50S ribosomal protein L18 [Acidobacteriota bacterium]|nr:50S ribosomal protein L18 [Acidobacteriota bacterium]